MMSPGKNSMEDWILFRYLAGMADPEEVISVEKWLSEDPVNKDHFEQLREIWKYTDSFAELESVDLKGDWSAIRARIGFDTEQTTVRRINPFNFNAFPLLKIAALVVIILVPAIVLERKFHIISSPEVNWITASTQSYTRDLVLPDGTSITLNMNSEISYPETFARRKREVNLKGEAWFNVAASEAQPFFIHTGNDLVIEVIGTSFTINSNMEKGEVLVRVISGKVSFYSAGNKRNKLILGKNEMGRHDDSGFSRDRIENVNFLSWKTGKLVFRDTPLREVAENLSWYSGRVVSIRGKAFDSLVLTASYEGQDLIEILEDIKLVHNVDYSIRNDTVIFFQAGE